MVDDFASNNSLSLGTHLYDIDSEMLRDQDGQLINLRPQSAQVLNILARALGRVVTKDELLDAVWPDVSVTEDSLVQCVSDIRKTLQDKDRTLLRTVPKRGYMLVASAPSAPPPAATDTRPPPPPSPALTDLEFDFLKQRGARLSIRLIETDGAPLRRQMLRHRFLLGSGQYLGLPSPSYRRRPRRHPTFLLGQPNAAHVRRRSRR